MLTHIIRFVEITNISIHCRPLVPYIQKKIICDFGCKVSSYCSFMQLLHHLLCFCVDRHRLNLLSYPILYKTSLFIVKGLAFLANYYFCHVDKNSSICLVYKKILASFNHSSSMKNKLASVVYSRILVGFVVLAI